jgi:hypothetical protein
MEFDNEYDWFDSYEKLKYASSVLLDKLLKTIDDQSVTDLHNVGLFESYMLLRAYSIENYLKGACIQIWKKENNEDHIDSFNQCEKLWGTKNGHQLRIIYTNCNVAGSSNEMEYLERLETFIKYAGRYFRPKDLKDVKRNHYIISSEDLKLENSIIAKIQIKMDA